MLEKSPYCSIRAPSGEMLSPAVAENPNAVLYTAFGFVLKKVCD